MLTKKKYDVVIVGSGLAGIFSGIRLQKSGLKVLILEQNNTVGGLCGTKIVDGYEFVIACNDFGLSMKKDMKELDIDFTFETKKTKIFYGKDIFSSPLNLKTICVFLSHPLSFLRFVFSLKKGQSKELDNQYLAYVVDKLVKDRKLNDLLKIPSYMMGLPPQDTLLKIINYDALYNYGYFTPCTPVGGPQFMINSLVDKFQELGGELELNTKYLHVEKLDCHKKVITDSGEVYSRYVISSQQRLDMYPENCKRGMKVSMFYIAVSSSLHFPQDTHTMIYYPPNISSWYQEIDNGRYVDEFGFHIFKSDLLPKKSYYTMNIYFYLPRDIDEPAPVDICRIENYIFEKLEVMLPGLSNSLEYKKFISPNNFLVLHNLSSRVTPIVMRHDFEKPSNHDENNDIYYIGNSVYPPGDHAGASLLSAKNVANMIIADDLQKKRLS